MVLLVDFPYESFCVLRDCYDAWNIFHSMDMTKVFPPYVSAHVHEAKIEEQNYYDLIER